MKKEFILESPVAAPESAVGEDARIHPAKAAGCSHHQIEVFEQIAIGQCLGHSPRILEALEKRGLIRLDKETRPATARCPWPVTVMVPCVPIPVHYAWCAWCAEQPSPPEHA